MLIPDSHIDNALQLTGADAEIDLFELTPSVGTGVISFTSDSDLTYRGVVYTGVVMTLDGEKASVEGGTADPQLKIGQPNLDLSMFKPLIRSGALDNAIIVRKTVLLSDLLANVDVKTTRTYRVGMVQGYNRSQITLLLRRFSGTRRVKLPFRQFLPPAFPYVLV